MGQLKVNTVKAGYRADRQRAKKASGLRRISLLMRRVGNLTLSIRSSRNLMQNTVQTTSGSLDSSSLVRSWFFSHSSCCLSWSCSRRARLLHSMSAQSSSWSPSPCKKGGKSSSSTNCSAAHAQSTSSPPASWSVSFWLSTSPSSRIVSSARSSSSFWS